ncbi:MAG: LysR family transcriptional regulator [bacterium]|nr:LysR family transcriptional regulator [bacterium]
MELHQLQVFVIVAEEENITRAAKRVFSTPSSISMTIKGLEDELGVQLFQRTSRGMQITERGRLLYDKAQKTLRAAQEMANYATEIQSSLIGQVTVGLNSPPQKLRVSNWVQSIRKNCAGIDLQLISSHSGRIMEHIKLGLMDIGFVCGRVDDPQLTAYYLTDLELVVGVPIAWKEQLTTPTWEQLAKFPWIGADIYCPFQTWTQEIFEQHALNYQRAVQTDDDATRIALVRAGVGLSLLEASEAREESQKGSLYVPQLDPIYCPLSLVCATHRQHEPLIKAVRQAILPLWGIEA